MAWQFWRQDAAQHTSGNSRSSNMPQQPVMDEDKLRTVARRRLIGAAVLVGLTVLIFPWVFKQQPRPLNDDLIIEVPRKEAAKPWANPGAITNTTPPTSAPSSSKPAAAAVEPPAVAAEPDAKPTAATAAVAAATVAVVAAKPTKPEPKPETKPETKPIAKAETKPISKPETKLETKPENTPETKPEAAAQTGRFVVQVAAFSDANKVRDTRIKLEAQGYKTYSQAIDSPKGKVWRVRVGPYGNKAEAEKAKAQLAGKGFAPALLEL